VKLTVLLLTALVAAAAAGGCPNKCSGHGSCVLGDKCECQALFVGNDCSERQCAFGLSWITAADTGNAPAGTLAGGAAVREGLGGRHLYSECSDKGTCDSSTGQCECYEGYEGKGCRRQKCPNDCSGHGRCVYNQVLNPNYSPQGYAANFLETATPTHFIEFGSQYWDRMKTRSCACDRGFESTDCSQRMCPKGDDPLTDCDAAGTAHQNDVQLLTFNNELMVAAAVSDTDVDGSFTLTFMDMFGGNYTTRPIEVLGQAAAANVAAAQPYADDMELALEALPNFVIPNVTVTPVVRGGVYDFEVEFVDAANAGMQNLLQCSMLGGAAVSDVLVNANTYNFAAAQPRFIAPVPTTPPTDRSDAASCTAVHKALHAGLGQVYKEHTECSDRGVCDGNTGLCGCFDGYVGEACASQTVFF